MPIDPFLVPVRVIAVFHRGERGLLVKQLLRGLTADVQVFQSILEAQQYLQKNLGHLIIGDLNLPEGSLYDLKAKLRQFPVLANIPVVAIQVGKEFPDIEKDGVDVVSWPSLDKDHLLRLVLGVHKNQKHMSLFGRTPAQLTKGAKAAERIMVTCPVTVLGRVNDLLVFRSQVRVDSNLAVTMIPVDKKLSPAAMNSGTNTTYEDQVFNTYPARKTQGIGLKWLMELPDLKYNGQAEKGSIRTVLAYGNNRDYLLQWQRILSGYHLQLVAADSWQHLAVELGNHLKRYSMILLTSDLEPETAKPLLATMESIPEGKRPNILVVASQSRVPIKAYIRHIVRPFGLGEFLDAIESAIPKPVELTQLNAAGNVDGAAIQATYQLAGSMICLDECGGAFQTTAAPQVGAELKIRSELLKDFLEPSAKIVVANVRFESSTRMYQVRFEYTHSGQTPIKRFEQLESTKAAA